MPETLPPPDPETALQTIRELLEWHTNSPDLKGGAKRIINLILHPRSAMHNFRLAEDLQKRLHEILHGFPSLPKDHPEREVIETELIVFEAFLDGIRVGRREAEEDARRPKKPPPEIPGSPYA